jgi:prepilin-type N-terminal cleavage/methylation domain-containing protein
LGNPRNYRRGWLSYRSKICSKKIADNTLKDKKQLDFLTLKRYTFDENPTFDFFLCCFLLSSLYPPMLPHKKQRSHSLHFLGFTLVELIVVITILAILATIAFLSFQGYSKNARDSARGSDVAMINRSIELFAVTAGNPPDPSGTITSVSSESIILWNQ